MLKNKILSNQKTIGAFLQSGDLNSARILGLSGYDFIWLDTEHSFSSFDALLAQIIAIKGTGTPVVVRLPQNDLTATKRTLEMGVDGVIFPMVRSAAEAEKVIADTLYPPLGTRGFGPMNAIDFGFKNAAEYTDTSDKNLCRFIQIEHKQAVEELDEIMKNPYIDGYIIGPNDLCRSYGLKSDVFCNEATEIISSIVQKLHSAGKYVGIASGGMSEDVLSHWESFSPDMLTGGSDFDFLREGALANRRNLEKIHK